LAAAPLLPFALSAQNFMLAFYRGALQSSLWAKILERIENINGDSAESDYLHYVLLGQFSLLDTRNPNDSS